MIQENKELLLQYLSAAFPFGVIVRHADYLIDSDGNQTGQFWYKRGYLYSICRLDNITTTIVESEGSDEEGSEHICDLERSLPYLRSMSSMTEEEKEEYHGLCYEYYGIYFDSGGSIKWLLKKHFDFMHLIPKNLAIEVTDENNPYKEE